MDTFEDKPTSYWQMNNDDKEAGTNNNNAPIKKKTLND
jgi:hypothetical protein